MASDQSTCRDLGHYEVVRWSKLSLEGTLGRYLPETAGTNKEQLRLDKVLIHQARLQPSLSFYQQTLEKEAGMAERCHPKSGYSKQRRPGFSTPVAASLFERQFKDTLWAQLLNSPQSQWWLPIQRCGFYFVKNCRKPIWSRLLKNFCLIIITMRLALKTLF